MLPLSALSTCGRCLWNPLFWLSTLDSRLSTLPALQNETNHFTGELRIKLQYFVSHRMRQGERLCVQSHAARTASRDVEPGQDDNAGRLTRDAQLEK